MKLEEHDFFVLENERQYDSVQAFRRELEQRPQRQP